MVKDLAFRFQSCNL